MKNIGNKLLEVTDRIDGLTNLVDYLSGHEEDYGALDRDLLLQKLREIYAMVLEIPVSEAVDNHSTEVSEPAAVSEPEPVYESEPIQEEVLAEEPEAESDPIVAEEPAAEPAFAPAEPEVEPEPAPEPVLESIEGNPFENVFEEPAPEPEPELEPEPEPEPAPVVEERPAKAKKESKHTDQPSLFDYLNSSTQSQYEVPTAPTLADKIGGSRPVVEEQLEQRVHANKVSDLRTVININDKFSFVNELFRNNMKNYTDFILKLNALGTRDEALAATAEVAAQYEWADDSLAVRTFYKILDRKF